MFFAPRRRALFAHLNFQMCCEPGVSCTCWLRNVLCATTKCTFSTSQLPNVIRTWGVFSFFTSKCASRHTGVQFFISHLARWLPGSAPAALASLLFDPPEPQDIGKTQCFATFLPFSRACIFFLLTLSLLRSSSFFSSLFSDSSHLCFFICPYCRKFDF